MMEKAMEISEDGEVRRNDSTLIRESRDSGGYLINITKQNLTNHKWEKLFLHLSSTKSMPTREAPSDRSHQRGAPLSWRRTLSSPSRATYYVTFLCSCHAAVTTSGYPTVPIHLMHWIVPYFLTVLVPSTMSNTNLVWPLAMD